MFISANRQKCRLGLTLNFLFVVLSFSGSSIHRKLGNDSDNFRDIESNVWDSVHSFNEIVVCERMPITISAVEVDNVTVRSGRVGPAKLSCVERGACDSVANVRRVNASLRQHESRRAEHFERQAETNEILRDVITRLSLIPNNKDTPIRGTRDGGIISATSDSQEINFGKYLNTEKAYNIEFYKKIPTAGVHYSTQWKT